MDRIALDALEKRYAEIEAALLDPATYADQAGMRRFL